MKTIFLKDGACDMPPCVATIGFFDGVHHGHGDLINHVAQQAEAEGLTSVAITFDQHPKQVLDKTYQPLLLNTFDEKIKNLSHTLVKYCVVLPFTRELVAMSARQFMEDVLLRQLHVRHLVVGYDHHFGHGRSEGFADYVRYGQELGITVEQWTVFQMRGHNISSSLIRRYLQEGEVLRAAECLGYYYEMTGRVVKGHQLGRRIGFPTANIEVPSEKQLPAPGVYAVKAWTEQSALPYPAMMNIGMRPTFGGSDLSLEVHIFGFQGDLYGQQLEVQFLHRVREEHRFSNKDELTLQLQKDAQTVKEYFHKEHSEWTGGHAL
ncbi:MAG: bifunctional riboflavin kinase/FAD synthetase [Prevotella sp.]|nr:bifunctional riboflavin kinase/FAD synthetase [Prevotella sp.]